MTITIDNGEVPASCGNGIFEPSMEECDETSLAGKQNKKI